MNRYLAGMLPGTNVESLSRSGVCMMLKPAMTTGGSRSTDKHAILWRPQAALRAFLTVVNAQDSVAAAAFTEVFSAAVDDLAALGLIHP